MLLLQVLAIAFAFLAPLALWAAHRRRPHPELERAFSWSLAALLLTVFAAGLAQKGVDGEFDLAHALPMQLCDWTLLATVTALLWRVQFCFELAYFWALCGTVQALFTPAIPRHLDLLRQAIFFLDHAGIVAGVLFLLLVPKLRPRSLRRVIVGSGIYLVTALAVNALTGANYGFLSHPPAQASLLDFLSPTRWLYLLEINLLALFLFSTAYLPWSIAERLADRRLVPADVTKGAPTPPA